MSYIGVLSKSVVTHEKSPHKGLFSWVLFLFLVDCVLLCDWVEFLELELYLRKLLLVLAGVIDMTLTDAFCVAYGYEFYELVL